ncbi:MAG: S41 family peptidase [Anaerolineae bacterium]|nr:S41 family peptidase [Anaerolineae bacterium]MCB0179250.1 S41 family peptidase [Anaerolineae bacterium]MCB0226188.1 S41 family peptidase [Anaerolineae bacterium]MCB9107975.1 S41 family peptidase [Anaerolineales bacterium]
MKKSVKIAIVVIGLFIITSGAFGIGVIFGSTGSMLGPSIVRAQDQPEEFDVFWQVWQVVHRNFIDKDALDAQNLTYGAINGLIQSLGDEGHTRFLTPEQVKQQRTNISGKFFGIGAQVGLEDGLPVIVAPFDDSPADKAGVQAGDIIVEVDGTDVTGLSLNETIEMIRGERGTKVVLTVFRPDLNESLEIEIVRDEIKVPAANWTMVPGTDTALVRLSQFSANLDDNLVEAIKEAEAAGATKLIVDVRNNPGGLLEQAIRVTSEFLTDGNVLIQEDADGSREAFSVRSGGVAPDIPIVVLINHGTASSSEIFAGAIQDHDRGQVVGETSFGTGTVLKPFDLRDGSALLLGTSQWLTANGRLIRKQGIEPDVVVELPIGTALLSPDDLEEITVPELLASEDAQLLRALDLLDSLPQTAPAPVEEQTQELTVTK